MQNILENGNNIFSEKSSSFDGYYLSLKMTDKR